MKNNHIIFLIAELKYGIKLRLNTINISLPEPTYNTYFPKKSYFSKEYIEFLNLLVLEGYILEYKMFITSSFKNFFSIETFMIKWFINNNKFLSILNKDKIKLNFNLKHNIKVLLLNFKKILKKKLNIINYKKIKSNNIFKKKKHHFIIKSLLKSLAPVINLNLLISLKYKNNKIILTSIYLISKPSRLIYVNNKNCSKLLYFFFKKNIKKKIGLVILSTDKGILSLNHFYKKTIGGKVICIIF